MGNVSLVTGESVRAYIRRDAYAQSSTPDHQSSGFLQPSYVRRRVTSWFPHPIWYFMLFECNTLACFECLDSDLLSCRSCSPICLLSSNQTTSNFRYYSFNSPRPSVSTTISLHELYLDTLLYAVIAFSYRLFHKCRVFRVGLQDSRATRQPRNSCGQPRRIKTFRLIQNVSTPDLGHTTPQRTAVDIQQLRTQPQAGASGGY